MCAGLLIKRTLVPVISGIKHIFLKPYTVKWPYEKVPNVPEENYRYDPKAGIAYPGYKGRHILYLDRCTGCSSCDIACQNIAEAITMTYAFDVKVSMDEGMRRALSTQNKDVWKALDTIIKSFSSASYVRYNSLCTFYIEPAELTQVSEGGEGYAFKLNHQPIFDSKSIEVFYEKLYAGVEKLREMGWRYELEEATVESTVAKLSKNGMGIRLVIRKLDMGYKQNKRSLFPSVDYGRCVFCGFCVDACPFYALEMTGEFELSGATKRELLYTPLMLAKRPEDFILTGTPPELNVIERARMVSRRLTW